MTISLMLSPVIAATAAELRDIAPPVHVWPYPLPVTIAAAAGGLLLMALAVMAVMKWWRSTGTAPPPSPSEKARRALSDARARAAGMDPYDFSILVSHVLREYLEAWHGFAAPRQTTPEFLNSVAAAGRFSPNETDLLTRFLDRCDLIKFARADATAEDNFLLVDQALQFISATTLSPQAQPPPLAHLSPAAH